MRILGVIAGLNHDVLAAAAHLAPFAVLTHRNGTLVLPAEHTAGPTQNRNWVWQRRDAALKYESDECGDNARVRSGPDHVYHLLPLDEDEFIGPPL